MLGLYLVTTYTGVKALDYDYGKEQKFEIPRRDHSVIVTNEGYYPSHISIFEGEKIKFFVTATTDKPSCLLLESQSLFMPAEQGKISEGEAYFAKAGEYKFYCPTGKINGRITVLERPNKARDVKRQVASQMKSRVWRPKDLPNEMYEDYQPQ